MSKANEIHGNEMKWMKDFFKIEKVCKICLYDLEGRSCWTDKLPQLNICNFFGQKFNKYHHKHLIFSFIEIGMLPAHTILPCIYNTTQHNTTHHTTHSHPLTLTHSPTHTKVH